MKYVELVEWLGADPVEVYEAIVGTGVEYDTDGGYSWESVATVAQYMLSQRYPEIFAPQ